MFSDCGYVAAALSNPQIIRRGAPDERQRLRALEASRSATALWLKAGDIGEEELMLLESNIASAEEAYRASVGSFEVATGALAGVREALRQRLDAAQAAAHVRVACILRMSDGKDIPSTVPVDVDLSTHRYFTRTPISVPRSREAPCGSDLFLDLASPTGRQDVKVYDSRTDALVWRSKIAKKS